MPGMGRQVFVSRHGIEEGEAQDMPEQAGRDWLPGCVGSVIEITAM
jgi:hypothetical protein